MSISDPSEARDYTTLTPLSLEHFVVGASDFKRPKQTINVGLCVSVDVRVGPFPHDVGDALPAQLANDLPGSAHLALPFVAAGPATDASGMGEHWSFVIEQYSIQWWCP